MIELTNQLTKRPVAVNVVLEWPQERRINLALEAGVRVVWTFWGNPAPYVESTKGAGALLIHTAGSVEEAVEAAGMGVDVLVLQGQEAGGHVRGTAGWRDSLETTLERVTSIPLLVAGGMANGGDVREALEAGASGACLGTRFLCALEANVAIVYQQRIIDAGPDETLLTELFDKGWRGAPHRVLRNSTIEMWESAGSPTSGKRPGETDQVAQGPNGGVIERYSFACPTREMSGDLEALALYAGESSAKIGEVSSAREIVERLVEEIENELVVISKRFKRRLELPV